MTLLAPLYDGRLDYSASQDRQILTALAFHAGVYGRDDYAASAGSGFTTSVSNGLCAVQNTVAGGSILAGLWLVPNVGSPALGAHPTPSTSWPRVDQVGIKVYDSETGGDASDNAQVYVVPGIASASVSSTPATALNAMTGGGSQPSNFLNLADVYVPANAASASAFTYRDRRPWMNGFHDFQEPFYGSSPPFYVSTSAQSPPTGWVAIDAGNLQMRVECAGNPLECSLYGQMKASIASAYGWFGFMVDGAQTGAFTTWNSPTAATGWDTQGPNFSTEITPGIGTHLITPCVLVGSASTTFQWDLGSILFKVQEKRAAANNGVV